MWQSPNSYAEPFDAERAVALALSLTLHGKSPRKVAKACARWAALAGRLEASAMARAGVYPIRAAGLAYGEREADREALAAARAIRSAVDALQTRFVPA